MMGSARRTVRRLLEPVGHRWGDWLLPATLLLIPPVSLLKHHGYPLWSLSALLTLAILVAVGLAASLLIAVRPKVFRPLIVAILLVYFVDFQPGFFVIAEFIYSLFSTEEQKVGLSVYLFIFILFFFSVSVAAYGRDTLTRLLAVVSATIFVSTALLPTDALVETEMDAATGQSVPKAHAETRTNSPRSLPPIVHIVLDEHIGPAGIPPEVPGADEFRGSLERFYLRHGFRLYGRAFSLSGSTLDSVSSLLNGSQLFEPREFVSEVEGTFVLQENAWFASLRQLGYRIRVYQTDYLDVCKTPNAVADYCLTVPSFGWRVIADADIPIIEKTAIIIRNYLTRSFLYRTVGHLVRTAREKNALQSVDAARDKLWSPEAFAPLALNGLDAAGRLVDELRSAESGTVYFAHLLVSHRPFVLDADCGVRRRLDGWYNGATATFDGARRLDPHTRTVGYQMYFAQLGCTQRLMARILTSLDEAGFREEAVVIIHGDHGSRISIHQVGSPNIPVLTEDDFRDFYSTLFAIRAPDVGSGYDESVRSIQALFAELVMGEPFADEEAVVYVTNGDDTVLTHHPFRALD